MLGQHILNPAQQVSSGYGQAAQTLTATQREQYIPDKTAGGALGAGFGGMMASASMNAIPALSTAAAGTGLGATAASMAINPFVGLGVGLLAYALS
jgi:hypothetical protein